MATVLFWEKPGCAGNTRQKLLLGASGHTVQARDLRLEPWTVEALRPFFGSRPVADWFNRSSPKVKSGEVRPDLLDEAGALALMLAEPLLIRRPLMQVAERRECGFDAALVAGWIGLSADRPMVDETCQRTAPGGCAVAVQFATVLKRHALDETVGARVSGLAKRRGDPISVRMVNEIATALRASR